MRRKRASSPRPSRTWKDQWPVAAVALAALVNGLLEMLQVLLTRLPEFPRAFDVALPFGLHHASRLLGVLMGFLLVYVSFHLWSRRHMAWILALAASLVAVAGHLGRGHDLHLALAPAGLAVLLLLVRRRFTVRSEPRSIQQGAWFLAGSVLLTFFYGAVGFWLLDRRDLGVEFHWGDSVIRTFRAYALIGNPDLAPHTRHARWFLDSLAWMGMAGGLVGAYSLFRPLAYRLRTLPHERAEAEALLEKHGRTSLDVFKIWPDKSFHFAGGGRSCVAYRAAWGVAMSLGDPIASDQDMEEAIRDFALFCEGNGWKAAFHQIVPDFLEAYRGMGFQVLKVGEEAIVDLAGFAAKTAVNKEFRKIRKRGEALGLAFEHHEPPHPAALIDEAAAISAEWLSIPGRRERSFTLGRFERGYLERSALGFVRDAEGTALAFANEVPSYRKGECTIDLMRHRVRMPNGTMDFLFRELLLGLAPTYRTFSMGLAPLSGVGDRPGAGFQERAVFQLYERLNRFFSYRGLRSYKAKFDPVWEERFLAYQGGPAGLLAAGVALTRVTEG
jgi:phosphatidylglycerol lysyltransferase